MSEPEFSGSFVTPGMTTGSITCAPKILPSHFQFSPQGNAVLRIESDGRIWWNDHYVEGDEEFKAAMMDLNKKLGAMK